jgi:hypothetical protein
MRANIPCFQIDKIGQGHPETSSAEPPEAVSHNRYVIFNLWVTGNPLEAVIITMAIWVIPENYLCIVREEFGNETKSAAGSGSVE